MGKYIRKSKAKGEVSPLGVLTRAKALAQKRNKGAVAATAAAAVLSQATGKGGDGGSYLELRSGKLVKPLASLEGKGKKNGAPKNQNEGNPNPNVKSEKKGIKVCLGDIKMDELDLPEAFGENFLDFEGRKRTTRESTPSSLIKDSDKIQTPGSSTRRSNANESSSRVPNSGRAEIPTTREIDAFFARVEEEQQRKFIEKYNFDPVNDKPLPGRFEWVKVNY